MRKIIGICAAVAIITACSASAQETVERTRADRVQDRDYYDMILQVADTTTLQIELTPLQEEKLEEAIRFLRLGETEAAMTSWEGFIADVAEGQVPMDVHALILFVLRASYLETNEDLRDCAERVIHYNEQKGAVREYLSELRGFLSLNVSDFPISVSNLILIPFRPRTTRRIQRATTYPEARPFERETLEVGTRDELEHLIASWEEERDSLESISQEAIQRLQVSVNRQAQLMQMMSNIMKILHDTALAIIRNLR